MHSIDVFFIVLTGVIAYRLYTILGTRNDHAESSGVVQDVQIMSKDKSFKQSATRKGDVKVPLVTALKQIEHADKTFSQDYFLQGAEKAFELIISSFMKGDKEPLKDLVSEDLFRRFSSVIDQRAQKEITGELVYFRVVRIEMKNVDIKDGIASIQVLFESEQTQILKDKDGQTVEGDVDSVDRIEDLWTFERPLSSNTPHWILIATNSVF